MGPQLLRVDPLLQEFVAEQRAYIDSLDGHFAPPPAEAPPILAADDVVLGDAGLHILRPEGAASAVYLHIHGGGFRQGNAAMADAQNSALARELPIAVASVEYRLAPEFAHPTQLDDCTAAALWLIENARSEFGTDVLLLGGESVGASLAVLTLLALRDAHDCTASFRAANLVVGNYDYSMTPSQRQSTEAHFLSPQELAATRAAAFPDKTLDDLRDPAYSSLYADLHDLPPALFTVGTADAVLDDSLFMVSRWQAAGNEARLEVYPEAPHLFLTYPTQMAAEAHRRIVSFLRENL